MSKLAAEIVDLRASITNIIKACERLVAAMDNVEQRVSELERLAGLHGTIVLPPDVHLKRLSGGVAVDDRRDVRAGG